MADEVIRPTLQASDRFAIDDVIDDAIRNYPWDERRQLRTAAQILPAADLAAALPNHLFGELQESPDIVWVRIQGGNGTGRTYATATSLRKYSSSALSRLSVEVHRALHDQQVVGRFQVDAIREYNESNGFSPDARVDGFQFSRRSGLSHFLSKEFSRQPMQMPKQKRKAKKEIHQGLGDATPKPTSFTQIIAELSSRKIRTGRESVGPGTRLVAASELEQKFGFKDCYDRLYHSDDVNWVYIPPTGMYATVSSLLVYHQGHHSVFSRRLEREVLRNRDKCTTLLEALDAHVNAKQNDSPYLPRAYFFVAHRSLTSIVVRDKQLYQEETVRKRVSRAMKKPISSTVQAAMKLNTYLEGVTVNGGRLSPNHYNDFVAGIVEQYGVRIIDDTDGHRYISSSDIAKLRREGIMPPEEGKGNGLGRQCSTEHFLAPFQGPRRGAS